MSFGSADKAERNGRRSRARKATGDAVGRQAGRRPRGGKECGTRVYATHMEFETQGKVKRRRSSSRLGRGGGVVRAVWAGARASGGVFEPSKRQYAVRRAGHGEAEA